MRFSESRAWRSFVSGDVAPRGLQRLRGLQQGAAVTARQVYNEGSGLRGTGNSRGLGEE